jgi:2-dehydro-3-deoxy-D-gluconate 5-dehydrogenase
MDLDLVGQAAIVTGASRGLGRAIAASLAAEGVRVLATARTSEALASLVSDSGGQIRPALCDMRNRQNVSDLADRAVDEFGRLDIVINNAGIAPAGAFLDQDQSVFDEVFEVNVMAPAVLSREAGRHLVPQRSGKIINIASTSGIRGKPALVAYSASKGALLQLTKALGAEWARYNIQVNAVCPGAYETDAQTAVLESPEILARRLRKIPAGRMGRVDEIGPWVCLLASRWSDFMTGSVLVSDGGEVSKL